MIKKYQHIFNLGQVCLDGGTLLVAYAAAAVLKLQAGYLHDASGLHVLRPLWMIVMLICAYQLLGLYTPMRSRTFRTELLMVARAHFFGFLGIFAILFIDRSRVYSREMSLLFVSLSFVSMAAERFAVRRVLGALRRHGYNRKFIVVVGAGGLALDFLRRVRENRSFGYEVIGCVDDEVPPGTVLDGVAVLGGTHILQDLFQHREVDDVVVTVPFPSLESQARLMDVCDRAEVRMSIVPGDSDFLSFSSSHTEELDGIPLLTIRRLFPK